ncbi:MAG: polysaccharide deacetylase [Acutalibacteraceae bacterium]|nr:polysaccharide deacetylase [Clostridia bacterium]MEE3449565.1 polysaccharide deacetylase [Acutalibacteraceae bacterium]
MEKGMSSKGLIGLLCTMGVMMVCIMSAMAVVSNKADESDTEKSNAQTEVQQNVQDTSIDKPQTDAQEQTLSQQTQTNEDISTDNVRLEKKDVSKTPHIFFHSLIVDNDLAFDNDEDEDGYNLYMTTVGEFEAILEQLYENNYVLVSPHDLYIQTADGFIPNELMLPIQKKPIVISQDDVNYYSYMTGDGFATKIVIKNGKPMCEYVLEDGSVSVGAYDLIPILDDFVAKHPDFSYNGAKATIAVTGFEGAFGYHNIIDPDSPEYQKECNAVRQIAEALKADGYVLASHSYGHIQCGSADVETLQKDTNDWSEQIGSLIGKTDVFIYPYGDDITSDVSFDSYEKTPKFEILYNAGFRYFLNVDSSRSAWMQTGTRYFRGARRNIDGYRMSHYPKEMSDLFSDVSLIFDDSRPKVPDLS